MVCLGFGISVLGEWVWFLSQLSSPVFCFELFLDKVSFFSAISLELLFGRLPQYMIRTPPVSAAIYAEHLFNPINTNQMLVHPPHTPQALPLTHPSSFSLTNTPQNPHAHPPQPLNPHICNHNHPPALFPAPTHPQPHPHPLSRQIRHHPHLVPLNLNSNPPPYPLRPHAQSTLPPYPRFP